MLIGSCSVLIARPLIGHFEPTFLDLILIIFLGKVWLLVELIFVEFARMCGMVYCSKD